MMTSTARTVTQYVPCLILIVYIFFLRYIQVDGEKGARLAKDASNDDDNNDDVIDQTQITIDNVNGSDNIRLR